MGVFSRLFRLCKADLHGVMDQMEDKSLLLKQYLREMEESLKRKENQLEGISRSCLGIQRDLEQRGDEAQKLARDLDLALGKEKDDIARMLIRKRRTLQSGSEQLQRQLEIMAQDRDRLAQMLSRQRLQYDQLKVKAAAFCQHAEQRRWEEHASPMQGDYTDYTWAVPTEDEIELELLQRKEALGKGGDA